MQGKYLLGIPEILFPELVASGGFDAAYLGGKAESPVVPVVEPFAEASSAICPGLRSANVSSADEGPNRRAMRSPNGDFSSDPGADDNMVETMPTR